MEVTLLRAFVGLGHIICLDALRIQDKSVGYLFTGNACNKVLSPTLHPK